MTKYGRPDSISCKESSGDIRKFKYMPGEKIRKFFKLIRRYKEILAEFGLWSSGRQPQTQPRAVPLLWIEVGTCLATLAWGVDGLDEIPRKAGASFAGARVLAFSFGLC